MRWGHCLAEIVAVVSLYPVHQLPVGSFVPSPALGGCPFLPSACRLGYVSQTQWPGPSPQPHRGGVATPGCYRKARPAGLGYRRGAGPSVPAKTHAADHFQSASWYRWSDLQILYWVDVVAVLSSPSSLSFTSYFSISVASQRGTHLTSWLDVYISRAS